jgi:hypothetical protein
MEVSFPLDLWKSLGHSLPFGALTLGFVNVISGQPCTDCKPHRSHVMQNGPPPSLTTSHYLGKNEPIAASVGKLEFKGK